MGGVYRLPGSTLTPIHRAYWPSCPGLGDPDMSWNRPPYVRTSGEGDRAKNIKTLNPPLESRLLAGAGLCRLLAAEPTAVQPRLRPATTYPVAPLWWRPAPSSPYQLPEATLCGYIWAARATPCLPWLPSCSSSPGGCLPPSSAWSEQ